jgi:hypothetical protein
MDEGSAHHKAVTYTQIQNKCRQISMPAVGFKPTIPVFKGVKTFHALDHTTTVTGHPEIGG